MKSAYLCEALLSLVILNRTCFELRWSLVSLLGAAVIRLSVAALWLLSPPLLVAFALRQWKRSRHDHRSGWKAALPLVVGTAVLADYVLFITLLATGHIGGFGTHYVTNPQFAMFAMLSLLLCIVSFAACVGRGKLSAASALVFALWAGSLFVA